MLQTSKKKKTVAFFRQKKKKATTQKLGTLFPRTTGTTRKGRRPAPPPNSPAEKAKPQREPHPGEEEAH